MSGGANGRNLGACPVPILPASRAGAPRTRRSARRWQRAGTAPAAAGSCSPAPQTPAVPRGRSGSWAGALDTWRASGITGRALSAGPPMRRAAARGGVRARRAATTAARLASKRLPSLLSVTTSACSAHTALPASTQSWSSGTTPELTRGRRRMRRERGAALAARRGVCGNRELESADLCRVFVRRWLRDWASSLGGPGRYRGDAIGSRSTLATVGPARNVAPLWSAQGRSRLPRGQRGLYPGSRRGVRRAAARRSRPRWRT